MAMKEMLHEVSAVLAQDERVLSSREKELLSVLLRLTQEKVAGNSELAEAVRATIDCAVGEIVAQRAFGVLGSEVLGKILSVRDQSQWSLGSPPSVPSPGDAPRPPGPSPNPPGLNPIQSYPRCPQAIHGLHEVWLRERPAASPAHAVVLDEFLAPQEVTALLNFTLAHEPDFRVSEVLSPGMEASATNFETRRSLVLMNLDGQQELMAERIQNCLPRIFEKLGCPSFAPSRFEVQITASQDGDFFRRHSDNAHSQIASRQLTFVYFFHREPKAFRGGELRIYESGPENDRYAADARYWSITPQQNQMVFFPSSLVHEITPVDCVSKAFCDSRFTVNGWLHQ